MDAAVARASAALERKNLPPMLKDFPAICKLPLIDQICQALYDFGEDHVPADDLDHDYFSPMHTLRGADWRGKDCDDSNPDVYPGRKPYNSDIDYDSNCNGIYGVDPVTGKPYEDLYCTNITQYGTIVLGDSATAHFHIPYQYLNVTAWTNSTFDRVLLAAENEFDWPLFSSSTGFANTSIYYPDIQGPSNSTYQV